MAANLNDAVRRYVTSRRGNAPLSIGAAASAISREFPLERLVSRGELVEMVKDEALVRRIPVESDPVH